MFNFAQSKHNAESAGVILALPASFFPIMSKIEHLCCLSFRDRFKEVFPPQVEVSVIAPPALPKNNLSFDPQQFLATIGEGRKVVAIPRN